MTIAHLISPPFACGATWLVNVLLELGIKTTNPSFEPGHWEVQGAQSNISEVAWDHLRWHLPVLHHKRSFDFERNLEVVWEHRLAFPRAMEGPIILYVRDPRDAIYSLYRRNYADALSYLDYLRRPDIWPYHFGNLFKLCPADTFAYFCFYWMSLSDIMNVRVVRFEDMRADPIAVTAGLLEFLGAPREDEEIERAIEASSFKKAKEAMQTCEQGTGKQFVTARRGKIGEWRETHGPEELCWFEGPANYLMWKLGYEVASGNDYSQEEAGYAQCLERLPSAARLIFDTVMGLDTFGDAEMVQNVILATSKMVPPSSLEAMWAGIFYESYDWVNKIFPTEAQYLPQRANAFQTFARLNGYFSPMPSMRFALQDAFSKVGYRVAS